MIRILAIIFGLAFIVAGVGGFLPPLMPNGLLLGLFQVDTMHNLFHIISGVVAIMCATSYVYSVWYFRIFGIIYGLLAIFGFVWGGDFGFLMMQMNTADHLLHIVIAIIALSLGFSRKLPA